ncbi:hypothetical protein [Candidatus Trichorickettsia mobilis]|uniref:hypothetical protein n=1 Tax=Candidatus Trichorickettsia mobilis TaxID=1346319 RepID=UPI00293132BB|nr:hypothetical protein [Candidatus Trichorickettsia mobilis]
MKKNPQSNNKPENTESSSNNNGSAALPPYHIKLPLPLFQKLISELYTYETVILGQPAKEEMSDADHANAKLNQEI